MATEFKINISGEIKGLLSSLDKAESALKNFEKKFDGLTAIGDRFKNIGQNLTVGLTLPIVGLGAASIKAYGDIQALQKGLEAVMGSAALANSEFNKLKEVAKLPGLGLEEAVKGSINLQAIGINADRSRDILLQFGNAVATVGKGRAEFERAIYGVQQLANTDFPLGEDLNIIADALPQVRTLLKDTFGKTRAEDLAKMGVSSQQVLDVILEGLGKLPRVTGGITGAFENLGDSLRTNLGRIGKIIDDAFDISGIIDKLTGYLDKAVTAFENLSPPIQKGIIIFGGLVAAAGPLLVALGGIITALPVITAGAGALGTAFTALTGPIGLVTAGIAGIIAVVVSNWDKIKPYIVDTINYFVDLYNESIIVRGAVEGVVATFKTGFAIVKTTVKTTWEVIKSFAKGVAESFRGIGQIIKGALTGDLEDVSKGFAQIAKAQLLSIADLTNDLRGGLKSLTTEIPLIFNEGVNRVKYGRREKITDISLIDTESTTQKVEDDIVNSVVNGVQRAKEKIGSLNLVSADIQPINQNFLKGFQEDEYNRVFDSQMALQNQFLKTSDIINNTAVPQIQTGIAEYSETLSRFNEQLTGFVNSALADGFADLFSSIGSAVAKGGNVLGAVGKSLLGTFGSILQELGKMLIKQGVALLAIKMSLKSLNPYIALAAGAALLALGSFVSAGVQNIGNNVSTGGVGSGSYSTSAGSGVSGANYSSSTYGSNYSSEVVFRISGSDLLGVMKKAEADEKRLNAG